MISRCRQISVDDKNHIFSIVQQPQRSGGQTIPRAVSGDQSRGLAAEILIQPRGRGFFHSQSQNHSETLHQSTTITLQHHNTIAPVHHHNITTPQHHNTSPPPQQPSRQKPQPTPYSPLSSRPFPFSLYMFFYFVIFESVIFISLHPFQDR